MAVALLNKEYSTNYCEFSFDNWNNDKDKLPTLNTPGKDALSTIKSCSQGSVAVSTDMSVIKVLNGDDNEWV